MRSAIIILCICAPLLAHAKIDFDPDMQPYPSPARLVESFDKGGLILEKSINKFIDQNCSLWTQKKPFCSLPQQISDFKKAINYLYSDQSPIYVERKEQVKLWDLRQLISGNVLFMPSESELDPLEFLFNLFEKRQSVLKSIENLNHFLKSGNKSPNSILQLMVPVLRAHVLSNTTLGSAVELFESLRCELSDRYCDQLKERLGALIALSIQNWKGPLQGLVARSVGFNQDHESERSRRLPKIIELTEVLNFKDEIDRPVALALLKELNEEGQGAFYDYEYYNLTTEIIAVAEALRLNAIETRLSPYVSEALNIELAVDAKYTSDVFRQSFESIERALNLYEFHHERVEEF